MSFFTKFSYRSRKRKLELFYELTKPSGVSRILDIGAQADPDGKRGLQLIDGYQWKEKLVAVNISAKHIYSISKHYPEIEARVADACDLPWPDKYFDIIYSNAVIEHVGNFERQKKMASEIMRVGKNWFVTTPNRWFPFEFHMRLPLVTWLPRDASTRLGQIISYNHVKGKYSFGIKHNDLHLLSAKEMQMLFPTSRIIKQRVTFMSETLIAIGGSRLKS